MNITLYHLKMTTIDIHPGLRMPSSSTIRNFNPNLLISGAGVRRHSLILSVYQRATSFRLRAFSNGARENAVKLPDKPSVCTADEIHYVSVNNSDWRLALWRYNPPPQVTRTLKCSYRFVLNKIIVTLKR